MLNLNNFKLLKETDDSYHVGHPNGKSLVVAKKGLSDKDHAKIKSMQHFAEGGQVPEPDPKSAAEIEKGAGGSTGKGPLGGQPLPEGGWKGFKQYLGLADGGGPIEPPTGPAGDEPNSSSAQDSPEQIAADAAQQPMPAAVAPTTQQTASQQSPMMAQQNALMAQKAANTQMAGAIGGQGEAESAALDEMDKKIHGFTDEDGVEHPGLPSQQEILQKYQDSDQKLADAYASNDSAHKLDPDRYYKDMSIPNRITAGIGLLLSGAGSGVRGQPNLAANMIQNAVNTDIQNQREDRSRDLNLWKMNRERLGTDLQANLATQNQLYQGVKYKLMQAASQFKGPIAQAQAAMGNAQIDQQIAQNNFKMSLMQPSSDNPDPSTRVQFLVPPERQQKVFDEIDAASATAQNGHKILDEFDKAANTVNAVDFIPGMQNAHQKALHALMGPTFKDVEGTVRQAAMDNMNANTTPQFGDSSKTTATKRAALVGYLTSKSSAATAKGFGIDLSKFPTTNFVPQAPGQPYIGQTKVKDGANWVKVPGGWKKAQ